MSEYWKSNPKKFCDYCKVWIQGNKSTIQLHEQGRNHKDKVAARLFDIKNRAIAKQKEDKIYNAQMIQIEQAAVHSMVTDLSHDPTIKGYYTTTTTGAASSSASKALVYPTAAKQQPVTQTKNTEKRKADDTELSTQTKHVNPTTKIGSWESIEKRQRVGDEPMKPNPLQLPSQAIATSEQYANTAIKVLKYEMDSGVNDQKEDLDGTDVNKQSTAEKLVTLNTSNKPAKGPITFKKRSINQQSARQRVDD